MKKAKIIPATRPNFKIACLLTALSISACVTVNVNFPESAVQKASDDYVKDLYRTKESGTKSLPKASATPADGSALIMPAKVLNFVFPSALADDTAQFNMNSPKIGEITSKLKAIVPQVLDQKKAGVLGENAEGKLVIHDDSKVKPLLKKRTEDLVNEDGKLRDSLYEEVISSNHLPSNSLPAVRRSFAHSFQAESPSGTWIQSADGRWSQKP